MFNKRAGRPVFEKYAGIYQLRIADAEDLDHLPDLEEGRWMATGCPLFGLRIDPAFLQLLDADGSGRIISDEVCAAARWLRERLRPATTWTRQQPSLPLELVVSEHVDGPGLLEAAGKVLTGMGRDDATEVSLDQIRAYRQQLSQLPRNGDGIVPPGTIENPAVAQFGHELIGALGGAADASGQPGLDQATLDQFQQQANAYLQWREKGLIPAGESATEVTPFGEQTAAMFVVLSQVRDKVDEFFAQCALVRFDPATAGCMGLREEERSQLEYTDRQAIYRRLQQAPLADPVASGRLPLTPDRLNEVFHSGMDALRRQVVEPLFGTETESLAEEQWESLLERFAGHEAWIKGKPTTALETLGAEKLRSYLDGQLAQIVGGVIASDRETAGLVQNLQSLESLVLLHQWLLTFVNNFVSFPSLFTAERAIFEMGTLVLEGREFYFSVQVENRAAHANLAKNSGMFLLYLQITGALPDDNFEIVVPVTQGNTDGLYSGRRGVFFTTEGRELDARIVQIVDNPVSFWNLMKAPARYLRSLVARRFERVSGSLQSEVESSVSSVGTQTESSLRTGLRQPLAGEEPGSPVQGTSGGQESGRGAGNARDLMIGLGFLAAGFGTALKFLSETARQLANPRTVITLLIILAVVAVVMALFTAISAWSKLRRRDLGVLLQASGWAINGRIRLTRVMARIFTRHTPLPPMATRRRGNAARSALRPARQQSGQIPA